jgi:hypothetical protein
MSAVAGFSVSAEQPAAAGMSLGPEPEPEASRWSPPVEEMEVVIAEPGPMGFALVVDPTADQQRIAAITPGGQMARHAGLQAGMALVAVDGVVVKSRHHGIELMSAAGRPVSLRFATAKSRALQKLKAVRMAASAGGKGVEVELTAPGPLGVELESDSVDGPPRVHNIVAGGQMSTHPEVEVGMTLLAVDGQVVASMSQCTPLIRAARRPVRLRFSAAFQPFLCEFGCGLGRGW